MHGLMVAVRYLPPGALIASAEPLEVTTILGSCVSVCLWDADAGIGGMNHYLLPTGAATEQAQRYGDAANAMLLERVLALGANMRRLRAKVFGGACVVKAFRNGVTTFAERNIRVAQEFLREQRIQLVNEDVGGERGRKLRFRTDDGQALLRYV
ncbi:MAG TPA: chemotaxis protein CheD [Thermoanaerobaculia bacterium]